MNNDLSKEYTQQLDAPFFEDDALVTPVVQPVPVVEADLPENRTQQTNFMLPTSPAPTLPLPQPEKSVIDEFFATAADAAPAPALAGAPAPAPAPAPAHGASVYTSYNDVLGDDDAPPARAPMSWAVAALARAKQNRGPLGVLGLVVMWVASVLHVLLSFIYFCITARFSFDASVQYLARFILEVVVLLAVLAASHGAYPKYAANFAVCDATEGARAATFLVLGFLNFCMASPYGVNALLTTIMAVDWVAAFVQGVSAVASSQQRV